MNVFTKSIRKIMGWCPNAKALETRSQTVPANFEAYDKSGGEKAGNNLSRMKKIGLLLVSIGALLTVLSNRVLPNGEAGWIIFYIGILLFAIGFILYIKY
ncbi:DUF1673 family protein [Methanosarcina sp.]|uniref:DUF1673 family protein n=1 Tax=Methanosarcina sp. TaxID=2213 RepID=UPI0029885B9F|nr:DUF1673 family protein [Methanosarcina sp.]MDW5548904.1 DUF1673 family protein [Methanosarcina sp.]MDW5552607.1 DUF1673 family protein [Methanosarcina sp.]MDW5559163.1 DUF1673 family protein [Methanosarcina sp.]